MIGLTIQHDGRGDGIVPYVSFDLLHNVIRNTEDAIDYEDGSGGVARYNTLENNTDDGFDLDGRLDIVIEHNIVRNNSEDGFER